MISYTGEGVSSSQHVEPSSADSADSTDEVTGQRRMTLLEKASLSQFYNTTEEVEKKADFEEVETHASDRPRRSSFASVGGHHETGQVFRPLSQSSLEPSIRYYLNQQRSQPEGFLAEKKNFATILDRKQIRKGSLFVLGTPPAVLAQPRRFSADAVNAADPFLSFNDGLKSFRWIRKYNGEDQTWEKIKVKFKEDAGRVVEEEEEEEEEIEEEEEEEEEEKEKEEAEEEAAAAAEKGKEEGKEVGFGERRKMVVGDQVERRVMENKD